MCPLLGKYECPICFEKSLLCPRMTKCGHIFCWSCILQYLHHRISLSRRFGVEKAANLPRKCPLCHVLISDPELKPCRLTPCASPELEEGKDAEFWLTARHKESIVVVPLGETGGAVSEEELWKVPEFHAEKLSGQYFTQIMAMPEGEMQRLLATELEQLEKTLAGSGSSENAEGLAVYIGDEISQIKESMRLRQERDPAEPVVLRPPKRPREETKSETSSVYYVYQIASGENQYLLPLNFKYLMDEFHKPELFPHVIQGRVLEIQHFQLASQLWKKYRYLPSWNIG